MSVPSPDWSKKAIYGHKAFFPKILLKGLVFDGLFFGLKKPYVQQIFKYQ